MTPGRIQNVVILGAGRLATHLGQALNAHGIRIIQVFNRTPERGRNLSDLTGASYTDDLNLLDLNADLYILAVSDSALEELVSRLFLKDKLVVHTSGSMEMDILAPVSSDIGVFYPVQTFSFNKVTDFGTIPVCIEANREAAGERLAALASILTGNVYRLDSEKRKMLHLGAVFVSNFTNFIYSAAEELLVKHDVPFSLLEPLITQTAGNAKYGNLVQHQTGPAARGDVQVLEKHYELLAGHPDFLEIYKLLSSNIIKHKI